jgi:hypothetical protein
MLPRRQWLETGAAVCSLFFASFIPFAHAQGIEMVSLEDARRMHEAGQAVLIDIREPQEHATGVAAGAKLLPMSQLGKRIEKYAHVRYVYGGMSDWAKRGWPMVSPAKH